MNENELREALEGKYFSLLGDSITTFDGHSNVDDTNSTVTTGENSKWWYPKSDVTDVSLTWWKRLIEKTGMKLLVNNSVSGSRVCGPESDGTAAINFRCENLHADRGELAGREPDIIFVYIGVNDVGAQELDADTICAGYLKMTKKIKARYPRSDIFLMNIPAPVETEEYKKKLAAVNEGIVRAAEECGTQLIRMRGSSADDGAHLTFDGVHPNAAGMSAYCGVICEKLYDYYCKKD